MAQIIGKEEFNDLVLKTKDEIVVVDFFASWCGPCRMISPILDEVCDELNVKLYKVDTDENGDLAQQNGVLALPTVMLFKNGEEISKFVGFKTNEEVKTFIQQYK